VRRVPRLEGIMILEAWKIPRLAFGAMRIFGSILTRGGLVEVLNEVVGDRESRRKCRRNILRADIP
jgi:hypothetical protein